MEKYGEVIKPWAIAVVVCIGVWIGGAALTRWYAINHTDKTEDDIAGVYGDSFGAVNALISALAFSGVIVTFRLQRKELDLQRQELKAQREEFTQQNKTLKLQRFENTFFHMMELQQQIVNDLCIQLKQSEVVANSLSENKRIQEVAVEGLIKGRQVFAYIYWHKQNIIPKGVAATISIKGVSGYEDSPNIEILDHYFRHLYTILRYVDETDAFMENDKGQKDAANELRQKYHYTTIIRATLSRFELLVLYYNGLSVFGREKLKPLIEKYALLNNIDRESLALSKELRTIFPAYQSGGWGKQYGLTGTDYEYYLTEEDNNLEKYNIKAFGIRDNEIENAKKRIESFEKIKEKYGVKPIQL